MHPTLAGSLAAVSTLLLIAGPAAAQPDARHVAVIAAAGAAYSKWPRVDARPNIAPFKCILPRPEDWGTPSQVRMSAAAHAPHGKKLYYARASAPAVYLDARAEIPRGFTIVKETFESVADTAVHPARDPHPMTLDLPPIDWLVTRDGEHLATGARADLYVMTKVGDVPGADAGWVYGTVSADGKVTSAGAIQSCIRCHADARHERLFGLPAAAKP